MALPTPNGSKPTSMVPPEWPAQAADAVVDTIAKVRDKTTKPALIAARALVYGILIAVLGTIAVVLVLILAIRALTYIPGVEVWMVYLGISVVFSLAGIWMLRRAARPVASA